MSRCIYNFRSLWDLQALMPYQSHLGYKSTVILSTSKTSSSIWIVNELFYLVFW